MRISVLANLNTFEVFGRANLEVSGKLCPNAPFHLNCQTTHFFTLKYSILIIILRRMFRSGISHKERQNRHYLLH